MTKVSDIGRAKLKAREGTKLVSYKDSVGVWTVGVGHTAACGAPIPGPGVRITAAEADACLKRDLAKFEGAVNRAVKVPLADHEFDALVSLCFNIGEGAFARSTVVKKLNAGDKPGAAKAIMLWNKPPEIIGRRKSEQVQFLTPYANAGPVYIPPVRVPPPPDIPTPEPKPDAPPAKPGFFARLWAWFTGLFRSKHTKKAGALGAAAGAAGSGQDQVTSLLSTVGEKSEPLKEAVEPLISYGKVFAAIFTVLSVLCFVWMAYSLFAGKKDDAE
jgi:lysozyme